MTQISITGHYTPLNGFHSKSEPPVCSFYHKYPRQKNLPGKPYGAVKALSLPIAMQKNKIVVIPLFLGLTEKMRKTGKDCGVKPSSNQHKLYRIKETHPLVFCMVYFYQAPFFKISHHFFYPCVKFLSRLP